MFKVSHERTAAMSDKAANINILYNIHTEKAASSISSDPFGSIQRKLNVCLIKCCFTVSSTVCWMHLYSCDVLINDILY